MSKKWLFLSLKILVSGILVFYLTKEIDFSSAFNQVADSNLFFLFASLFVMWIQICVGGFRWRSVLIAIGQKFSVLNAIKLFYVGAFFSQALPSAVGGDPVRIYMSYRYGLTVREAINGVLLERVVTVVALIIVVAFSQPWLLPRLDNASIDIMIPTIIIIIASAIIGIAVLLNFDRLPKTLMRWQGVRGLGNLGIDGRKVFLSKKHFPLVLFWGILTHVNISISVFLIGMGLNLDISLINCMALMPLVVMIMTIPISIGGWGVRETAMVSLFGLVGVPNEGALVLSVLVGLIGIVASLPGGLIWLLNREDKDEIDGKNIESDFSLEKSL
jgi:uncharacterized membrane protein YbhN (UPF0104 family)